MKKIKIVLWPTLYDTVKTWPQDQSYKIKGPSKLQETYQKLKKTNENKGNPIEKCNRNAITWIDAELW